MQENPAWSGYSPRWQSSLPARPPSARARRPTTRTSRSRSSRRCSPAAASTSSRAPSPTGSARRSAQPIVVENQSGGGGVVGSLATARAAPDGYTLMVGYVGTHGTNPAVRKLPYDAVKDFTPIAMVGGTPNMLVVSAVAAGQHAAGIRRLREGESRQALVRLVGSRHADAPRDGAVQGRRRPRHRARSVSRHRPGDHRHPRRPDAGAVPGPRRRAAAHQGRQDEAARGHRHQAPSAAARRADLRGIGLQGLRRRAVVRHRRPGEPARARSSSA